MCQKFCRTSIPAMTCPRLMSHSSCIITCPPCVESLAPNDPTKLAMATEDVGRTVALLIGPALWRSRSRLALTQRRGCCRPFLDRVVAARSVGLRSIFLPSGTNGDVRNLYHSVTECLDHDVEGRVCLWKLADVFVWVQDAMNWCLRHWVSRTSVLVLR